MHWPTTLACRTQMVKMVTFLLMCPCSFNRYIPSARSSAINTFQRPIFHDNNASLIVLPSFPLMFFVFKPIEMITFLLMCPDVVSYVFHIIIQWFSLL